MTYSKKQMMPLITKYGINPETNQLFIDICEMFDGQPNYQLWGVKVIFSKVLTMDTLQVIKEWSDKNQTMVKQLSKQNIIPYSTSSDINMLLKEMAQLDKISFVKGMVAVFNTAQRKMLEEYIDFKSLNGLSNSRKLNEWYDVFAKFSKLPTSRKENFIRKNSATRSISVLIEHIKESIATKYEWNREDLLAFVENNTPDCSVVYDNGKDIVILNVTSYKSSATLCAGGRTAWCITTSENQWSNYVTSKKNSQYFFFDFSKKEEDELAHIGFTVNDNHGIQYAHSTKDACLMGNGISYNGKNKNIFEALKDSKVPYGTFMPIKNLKDFEWNVESALALVAANSHEMALAYHNGERVIINVMTNNAFLKLVNHTFIPKDKINVESSSNKVYVFLDFGKDKQDENSINTLLYVEDQYKTPSLNTIYNAFGQVTTKDGYFKTIGITSDDYLHREDINPDILFHKYIDEGEEESALKLMEEKADTLNINYEFNGRIPVFSAMQNKMFNLVSRIIENDKFDFNTDDSYGEPLLSSLLYLYTCDEIAVSKEDKSNYEQMIRTVINCDKIDVNAQDINLETAICIAAEHPELSWVVEILASRPETDINVIDEFDMSPFTNALRVNNTKALEIIGKRPDLIIRDNDRTLAKEHKIDLSKVVNPQPMEGLDNVVRKKSKAPERDFAKLFEMAMKACC